jgi:prepilin-type N-terminal cleavage/methylation domain-containing protein
MKRKNQKGFTLVEVIVVAVIVAVLAAVAIPLYIGYIQDANRNAANNAAGSCASFCAAAINSGATGITNFAAAIPANTLLTAVMPATWGGTQAPTYRVPDGVSLACSDATGLVTGGTVTGTKGGQTGTAYTY